MLCSFKNNDISPQSSEKAIDVLKLSKEAMIPSIRLLALPRVAVFSCSLLVKMLIIERTFCNMNK